ncbi:protein GLE1-like isoform X1 [Zingiber officinale]|nr:protein GLE1-like isoform X1 [Zingiber officinale]
MKWDPVKGSAINPTHSDYIQLEPPCSKSSLVVASVDPDQQWTMDDFVAGLQALELKLGFSSSKIPSPLKQLERVLLQESEMHMLDKTRCESDQVAGWRMTCPDFDSSDFEGSVDDLSFETTKSYAMDKQNLEKSIFLELERQSQLRLKEELRSKLADLVASQRSEINRSASAMTQISKYVEVKQEMDRKLDRQYQRKIAEMLDSHLSAVQRDHEQRSLIEERRLRDDAAFEEAKKRALIEEKHRREKVKAEAEAKLKAAKLAEEAERTTMEAAQRAAKESAETETVSIREAAASEDARKKSTDDDNTNTKDTTSLPKMPKEPLLTDGIKVLATDAALKAEIKRLKIYNEVIENPNLPSQKELDRRGRQISKILKQLTGTVENVRTKKDALVNILSTDIPGCPSSISATMFAKQVIAWCEDSTGTFDSTVFACGRVILLVTSKIPDVMDFLVAEFHKVCIYTVPKYLQPSDQASQNDDYWKMIGYHEKDGKIESSESYLNRVQSYMKLYAAIIQTQIEGIRNPHGLGKGWSWLARFLNALPANKSTAYALEAFLKMAGFALYRKYKYQFKKMLDVISRSYLPAVRLKEKGDRKIVEVVKKLEQYLEHEMFRKEPDGWRLHDGLLSKELV